MRALIAAIVLVSSLSAGAGNLCETFASVRAQVVANLVKRGIEERAIELDDAIRFTLHPEWYNPFVPMLKRTETISFRNGFARAAKNLTEDEKASVRVLLSQHLRLKQEQQNAVSEARVESAEVFAPKALRQMPVSDHEYGGQQYTMSILDGRPIFMTRMKHLGTQVGQAILFDPFHEKIGKQVVKITGFSGATEPQEPLQFFEKDGIPYAMDFRENGFLDLRQGKAATLPEFLHRENSENYYGATVFNDNGGTKVFVTYDFKKRYVYEADIVLLDLDRPEARPQVIKEKGVIAKSPHVDVVGDRTFISYWRPGLVTVYDAKKGRVIKSFKTFKAGGDKERSFVYEDRGRTYLVYADYDRSENRMSVVRVADLNSYDDPKIVRPYFDNADKMTFIKLNGVPYVYFPTADVVALVNLRTKKAKYLFPGGTSGMADTFMWKGKTYLAWTNFKGILKIYDLETGREEMSVSNVLPQQVTQIFTFEYQGQIYLFASVFKQMPFLFKITGRDSE